MTNLERARKMAQEIVLESRQDRFSKATLWEKHLEEFIAAQLDEVEREAKKSKQGLVWNQGWQKGWNEAREKAKGIVDSEEELNGPIPQEVLEAVLKNPEYAMRATVRRTKINIAKNIGEMEP